MKNVFNTFQLSCFVSENHFTFFVLTGKVSKNVFNYSRILWFFFTLSERFWLPGPDTPSIDRIDWKPKIRSSFGWLSSGVSVFSRPIGTVCVFRCLRRSGFPEDPIPGIRITTIQIVVVGHGKNLHHTRHKETRGPRTKGTARTVCPSGRTRVVKFNGIAGNVVFGHPSPMGARDSSRPLGLAVRQCGRARSYSGTTIIVSLIL